MKVLMVEDDPLERLSHEHYIRSLGFECDSYLNAETALEPCHQTFYPLIITELELPYMNGLELCRHIRSLPHGAQSKILVVNTHEARESRQTAYDAGADAYLNEPVSQELLMEYIMELAELCA